MKRTQLIIAISQAVLLISLGLSFSLQPDVVAGPGGFSNYGVVWPTSLLYSVGFLAAGLGSYLTARQLTAKDLSAPKIPYLQKILYALAIGYSVILLSTYPYQLHAVLNYLHTTLGAIFVALLNLFALHILRQNKGSTTIKLSASGVWLGSLIGLTSLAGVTALLAEAQLIVFTSFAVLLTTTFKSSSKKSMYNKSSY